MFNKEDFINNKAWIHITRNDILLLPALADELNVTFSDGTNFSDQWFEKLVENTDELWVRHEEHCSYLNEHPRTSSCYPVSPWIYKHGEIVDVADVLNISPVSIEEEEFDALFK